MNRKNRIRATIRTAGLLAAPILLGAAFFGAALWGGEQFAFRDIAHFYHPLDAYTDAQRAESRSVDWMPYENFGQPLAAVATTAAWYPLKGARLLLHDKPLADTLFLLAHLLIATATFFRLARYLGGSRAGSLFGATAYAFGGSVLYQYTNPPFLIGAAWFPEAFLRLYRIAANDWRTHQSRAPDGIGLAVVLGLTILGGDPQAVYHLGLVGVALLLFELLTNRAGTRESDRSPTPATRAPVSWGRGFGKGFVCIVGAFLFAAALAAIQILPSLEFTRLSERTLVPEVQHRAIYDFSVPPFRMIEFVYPNIGGRMFPVNSRWFAAWDAERVWVPSLSMGFVPFLLAVASMRFWSRKKCEKDDDRYVVFLTWFAVVAVLFAFGRYVPFYEQLTRLPGYASFRYPAKWLTVAAVPLALLAVRGFDRLFHDARFRTVVVIAAWLLMSLPVLLFSEWNRWPLPFESAPACPTFGPCDVELAKTDFQCALFQTAFHACTFCVAVGFFTIRKGQHLMRRTRDRGERLRVFFSLRTVPVILIGLLCLDLYTANRWMIATCERSAFEVRSPIHEAIFSRITTEPIPEETEPIPPTVYRCPWWGPPSFAKTSSPDRLAESVRWDIQSLWSKYPLLAPPEQRIISVDVRGTMMRADYFRETNQIRRDYLDKAPEFEDRLAVLGVRWVIAPASRPLDPRKAVRVPLADAPEDVALWILETDPGTIASEDAPGEVVRRATKTKVAAHAAFHNLPAIQRIGKSVSCVALGVLVLFLSCRFCRLRRTRS